MKSTKAMTSKNTRVCKTCKGTGRVKSGNTRIVCKACNGSGSKGSYLTK